MFVLATLAVAAAGLDVPYPRSRQPTGTLMVYSRQRMSEMDVVTLETLGGGLAREQPKL